MDIEKLKDSDYTQVAIFHQRYINTGFLSSLGLPFLKLLYKSTISSKYAFCFIAEEDGKITGFISGVINVGRFYKEFLMKQFLKASVILLPKVLSIRFLKKILETLFYPKKIKKNSDLPSAELLSIVVEDKYRGKGVGKQLFDKLMEEFKKNKIAKFKVVVGSNLLPAYKFYEKMGGILHSEIEVHRGEKSKVYVWKI